MLYWIGVGFLLAFGAWLFTVVLRWAQRNPLVLVNAVLIGLTVIGFAAVLLAWTYSWWAGLIAAGIVSSFWQAVMARKSPFVTAPPSEPSPPSV